MKYVMCGATSGTGNAVLTRLVRKVGAENLTCLVRPTSDCRLLQQLGVRQHLGDVSDSASLKAVLSPTTVYLDMTHPRYYQHSLAALAESGVERAYYVTTTGIFSKYHRCSDIYKDGENRIREAGPVYTILRPSMIYGSSRDKNIHRLILFIDKYPVFPLFDGGRSLMQPVFVDDLADGIVAAIGDPGTENREYNLAGPVGITYLEIIDEIIGRLGRSVRKISIDTGTAYGLVRALQWLPGFPINDEQVLRLREDKVFDISPAVSDLNYRPRSFADGIGREIVEMANAGVLRRR